MTVKTIKTYSSEFRIVDSWPFENNNQFAKQLEAIGKSLQKHAEDNNSVLDDDFAFLYIGVSSTKEMQKEEPLVAHLTNFWTGFDGASEYLKACYNLSDGFSSLNSRDIVILLLDDIGR